MLISVLLRYLQPHRKTLAIVGLLQLVQTITTLSLPSLNAHIIDRGVARGDTRYIWRVGALMLAISMVQVAFSVCAVYFGSRAAISGRDVRVRRLGCRRGALVRRRQLRRDRYVTQSNHNRCTQTPSDRRSELHASRCGDLMSMGRSVIAATPDRRSSSRTAAGSTNERTVSRSFVVGSK